MDPTFISRNLEFPPVETTAAFGGPTIDVSPAVKQQPGADWIGNNQVQRLKDALRDAMDKLKTANEENKSLKEKVAVLEDARKKEVSRLQEDLKQKDEALKRCQKKKLARTKAFIDLLCDLHKKDMEIKDREQYWSSSHQLMEAALEEEKKKVEAQQIKIDLCQKFKQKEEKWKKAAQMLKPVSNQHQELAFSTKQQKPTLEKNSLKEKLEKPEAEVDEAKTIKDKTLKRKEERRKAYRRRRRRRLRKNTEMEQNRRNLLPASALIASVVK